MNRLKQTHLLAFTALVFATEVVAGQSDEGRIWMDLKINGKPVRMAFDTGSPVMVLFQKTADRLGIYVTNPPVANKGEFDTGASVQLGWTEPCVLSGLGEDTKMSFAVLAVPDGIHTETEGLVGWEPLKENVLLIEAQKREVHALEEIPEAAEKWFRFPIATNFETLLFDSRENKKGRTLIAVDTGNSGGVGIHPAAWREWKKAHPKAPTTLDAHYMPGAGLQVQEIAWAEELELGWLGIRGVTVRQANSVGKGGEAGERFLATLGLEALSRLEFIADGKHREIRWRPVTVAPESPPHNRLGAVFTPKTLESESMLASVLPGTPAYEAGVRSGDELLAVDGTDVTQWKKEPERRIEFDGWRGAAGTRYELTLKRAGKTFRVKVVLRELIGPKVSILSP